MPKQYPPEIRQKAVRLVAAVMEEDSVLTEYEAIRRVAAKMHVAEETVRRWLRKAQVDAGERTGTTSAEHAEIRRLKRELAEACRANEILKAASAFFAAELDRPTTK